ncbi:MAG: 30S ribosomal protein S3 [Candidatus Colwellbacteria bacterium RIFCSPLOWO2_12_FULL_43_11]|uniref:Small ribosomal subunit protein uS3 n=1 Tax=Candidatus Colwellbacteria bacterium RIFCSPLOWO2_12_FULL_43_11 TaxID=1797693 RepID=A0A1G1ZA17_9BACT|nr:MAG: 30S ribosomal protein S3 [Candidatus Colwellbacteria bacterium RIFCSPLOWO2_12_FULL_43_11]
MANKIRPDSFRLGIIKSWNSRWINRKNLPSWLEEDEKMREIIMSKIGLAGIAGIEIERTSEKCKIFIKASRPGLVIGRGGKGIEDLTKLLEKVIRQKTALSLNVEELRRTEVSAAVLAQSIAWDLEKRMRFRRTMKKYLDSIMQNRNVYGAKIKLAGRLDGNEIARSEQLSRGKLPLSTLRANIDYGTATAFTTYGTIGIKVWVYKGDIFEKEKEK